jgi:outer membrane immunogenic protein
MRVSILAIASALGLALCAPVQANDAPPLWAGIYAGILGTQIDGSKSGDLLYEGINVMGAGESVDLDYDGHMIGGLVGFNWQTGILVLGAEVDMSFGDVAGGQTYTMPGGAYKWKIDSQLNMLATLRGRLGVALGPVLVYGTGGLAAGSLSSDKEVTSNDGHPWETTALDRAVDQHYGFVYGAGAEWQVWNGLSIKAEWLRINLGKEGGQFEGTAYPNKPACVGAVSSSCSFDYSTDSFRGDIEMDLIRAGLNYKF